MPRSAGTFLSLQRFILLKADLDQGVGACARRNDTDHRLILSSLVPERNPRMKRGIVDWGGGRLSHLHKAAEVWRRNYNEQQTWGTSVGVEQVS